jgi:hypothetical protein
MEVIEVAELKHAPWFSKQCQLQPSYGCIAPSAAVNMAHLVDGRDEVLHLWPQEELNRAQFKVIVEARQSGRVGFGKSPRLWGQRSKIIFMPILLRPIPHPANVLCTVG